MNGRIIYQKDDEASLREMKALNAPSKLARFSFRSSLDQSKRARVYEHRHPENPIDPVCAFREHKD